MRFRPANISLINRRHYLPRLLLTLSSKRQMQKPHNDSKMLTGSTHINFRIADDAPQSTSHHCWVHGISWHSMRIRPELAAPIARITEQKCTAFYDVAIATCFKVLNP